MSVDLSISSVWGCEASLARRSAMARRIGIWVSVLFSVTGCLMPAGSSTGSSGGYGAEASVVWVAAVRSVNPVAAQPCGAGWHEVPGENLWPSSPEFKALAATGPNDVWLVGSIAPSHYDHGTLVEHWDGCFPVSIVSPGLRVRYQFQAGSAAELST